MKIMSFLIILIYQRQSWSTQHTITLYKQSPYDELPSEEDHRESVAQP